MMLTALFTALSLRPALRQMSLPTDSRVCQVILRSPCVRRHLVIRDYGSSSCRRRELGITLLMPAYF